VRIFVDVTAVKMSDWRFWLQWPVCERMIL